MSRKTILILAADPSDPRGIRARVDRETRDITNSLRGAMQRESFDVRSVPAPRVQDLRRSMLDIAPSIVHFCGHGTRRGLVFESDDGEPHLVGAEALANFFGSFTPRLECVVLNACHSEGQAEAIARYVTDVVGTSDELTEATALAFAVAFYDGLGSGREVPAAFDLARSAIQLADLREEQVLILYHHGKRYSFESAPRYPDSIVADDLNEPSRPQALTRLFLPARLGDFAGRRNELNELERVLLTGPRRATVSGMGGAGKTQLVIESAHCLYSHFPNGVFFVDMLGMRAKPLEADEVAERVVHEFDPAARLSLGASWFDLFHERMAGKRALLIVDNARDQASIKRLIPPEPVAFIVTARRRLRLSGAPALEVGAMDLTAALEMLHNILGGVDVNDSQLEALGRMCGFLPLALRAAGTHIAVHKTPLGEYIEMLEQARHERARLRYVSQAKDVDEDLDVETVLCLSLDRLVEENEGLAHKFVDLVIFREDFDPPGAAALWGVALNEAQRSLEKLVARSLVERDQSSGRLRLHDLLRDLAETYLVEQS